MKLNAKDNRNRYESSKLSLRDYRPKSIFLDFFLKIVSSSIFGVKFSIFDFLSFLQEDEKYKLYEAGM